MEELLQDELIAVISDDALCATDRRRSRIVENSSSMKLVRCFKGVYNSQQEIPLMRALQEFLDIGLVKVEYLLCNQVKKYDGMSSKWWLGSLHWTSISSLLNIVELLGWNMTTLIFDYRSFTTIQVIPIAAFFAILYFYRISMYTQIT